MIIEFQVQGLLPFMKEVEREAIEKGRNVGKEKIRNLTNYLKAALHNAPKRSTRLPKTATKPNSAYRMNDIPNRIYFPYPDGGIYDSGMTVEEFMKSINGGFRAKGAGSFQKEKVQTRVRGTKPPGTYAYENQRPGEFFTKGTGKIPEQYRLENIRKRQQTFAEKQDRKNFKSTLKEARKIRELEREAEKALDASEKKRKRMKTKISDKVQRAVNAREKRRIERDRKLEEFEKKNRAYRIVIPKSRGGYTDKPIPKTLLRESTPSGSVPRTWSGGGLKKYFISRNWKVKKVGDIGAVLYVTPAPYGTPQPAEDDDFLHRLENGGTMLTSRFIIGYLVRFHSTDKTGKKHYSHQRISFQPLFNDSDILGADKISRKRKQATPHPFVKPTIDKVQKEIQDRNS